MDQTLWNKIESFNLDEPIAEYCFSVRLAYENSWGVNFTQKAILEYKKFMYLAATSSMMVSPSEIVDIVWHQHLIFTQSYSDFCAILGKKIEHIPSTHNRAEKDKFRDAKDRTTRLYEAAFGKQPEAFWEFTSPYQSKELEASKYDLNTLFIAGAVGFFILSIPFFFILKPIYTLINNPYFGLFYLVICVFTFFQLNKWNKAYQKSFMDKLLISPVIADLTASEVLYMKTGYISVIIHDIINRMILDKTLSITTEEQLTKGPKEISKSNPLEIAIISALEEEPESKNFYFSLIANLKSKPVFNQFIKSNTEFLKHFIKSKEYLKIMAVNYVVLLSLIFFGFMRMVIGIYRDKQVDFIVIFIVLLSAVSIFYLSQLKSVFTKNLIPDYFQKKIPLFQNNQIDYTYVDWGYVVMGSTFLLTSFRPLVNYVDKRIYGDTSSGSSCGSSCSSCSSGGGSSCSSCGGCGGGGGD